MGIQVAATAQLMCSFGVAPSVLTVVPKGRPVQAAGQMAATIQDFAALTNSCMCNCARGGVITMSNPGQMHTQTA